MRIGVAAIGAQVGWMVAAAGAAARSVLRWRTIVQAGLERHAGDTKQHHGTAETAEQTAQQARHLERRRRGGGGSASRESMDEAAARRTGAAGGLEWRARGGWSARGEVAAERGERVECACGSAMQRAARRTTGRQAGLRARVLASTLSLCARAPTLLSALGALCTRLHPRDQAPANSGRTRREQCPRQLGGAQSRLQRAAAGLRAAAEGCGRGRHKPAPSRAPLGRESLFHAASRRSTQATVRPCARVERARGSKHVCPPRASDKAEAPG